MAVWSEAEVLDCLTMALGSTEKNDVGTSRCTHGELIEGDALAASLLNASTSSCGEAQCTDCHLRDFVEAIVICNSGHYSASLAFVCLLGMLVRGDGNDLREGNWWLIDLA